MTRPSMPGAARRTAPQHAPRVPFALLVLGLLVGGMCALLALNTASAANELSRQDTANKDSSIAAQLVQLQNDVAASAAPGNLASAAAQLGMVPDGDPAFLEIGANGKVRVLGRPAPATAAPQPKVKTTSTAKITTPKTTTPKTATPKTATPTTKATGTPTGKETPTGAAGKSGTTKTGTTKTAVPPTTDTTLPGGDR